MTEYFALVEVPTDLSRGGAELLLPAFQQQAGVDTAKTKTVRKRITHLLWAGHQRHQVQTFRVFIGVMQVQRRRHHLVAQRLNGENSLNPASCA